MWLYFLNWMGPIKKKWTNAEGDTINGDDWCCGRIDCVTDDECDPDYIYGREIMVPLIDTVSWELLSKFCLNLSSKNLLTFDEIIDKFESQEKHTITFQKERN